MTKIVTNNHRRELVSFVEPGCYLDSNRGHYIHRDVIWFAEGCGYLLDPLADFALNQYADLSHEEDYPHEALYELTDKVVEWLNSGDDHIPGQNHPPAIPEGSYWDFNDGDFGLWQDED